MSGPPILLVDDDRELGELLVDYLAQEGFAVAVVHDGNQGLEHALSERYGLVILDVMLPGMNGFEVLRRIRERSRVPVLMLTARGDDVDRIVGLEMGADDYLPKPYNPREMVARIRAILRRATPPGEDRASGASPVTVTVGDIQLDPATRVVEQAGRRLSLTSVEFTLLESLLCAAGQVVSRETLCLQVLGREFSPYDRSIDVHISNLRRKLGSPDEGLERIQTIRGVGYLYVKGSPPGSGDSAE